MERHLISGGPLLFMSDAALSYASEFMEGVSQLSEGKPMTLVVDWVETGRILGAEFTRDFDDLKKSLSQEDFQAELEKRVSANAVPQTPYVELGAAESERYQDDKAVLINGLRVVVEAESFKSVLAERNTIDLIEEGGKSKLILSTWS